MIAIIDYKAGNIGSIQGALTKLGQAHTVTNDSETILAADGVIFPGQGRAGTAMNALRCSGLDKIIPRIRTPFLGICLGLQLLTEHSDEDDTRGLGVLSGRCRRFPNTYKVPHLGWNAVEQSIPCSLFDGIADKSYFYFIHSYYCDNAQPGTVIGMSDYGFTFASALKSENFYAVQFHPEKSGLSGLHMLKNFANLC